MTIDSLIVTYIMVYGESPDITTDEFWDWAEQITARTEEFMSKMPANLRAQLEEFFIL